MVTVSCVECARKIGRPVRSEYPDRDGAAAYVRRHHALVGHVPDVRAGNESAATAALAAQV